MERKCSETLKLFVVSDIGRRVTGHWDNGWLTS
jgi:hypothetical protein